MTMITEQTSQHDPHDVGNMKVMYWI